MRPRLIHGIAILIAANGCSQQTPKRAASKEERAATPTAKPTPRSVLDRTGGTILTYDNLQEISKSLLKSNFESSASFTRRVKDAEAKYRAIGVMKTQFYLPKYMLKYNAEREAFDVNFKTVLGLETSGNVVLARKSLPTQLWPVSSLGAADEPQAGENRVLLQSQRCPVTFAYPSTDAQNFAILGKPRIIVQYRLDKFQNGETSTINKLMNVAWDSGVVGEVIVPVKMKNAIVLGEDGQKVAQIACG